ncbi:unnamed protein product [Caenorhabditis angaria]|uniref:RecQ-mediated genome instability protein 1 n=1 Tax=Caenorhabditis angaria TaxID=860376 RepID=A0A9P1IT13_9PELO|nr:unnamed protein product [Caenorhabditis angaria]
MADFVREFFADRYILLKDEWLEVTLRFLKQKFPGFSSFNENQLANLIFEQWKCSNFGETSFGTFSNHGISPSCSKSNLQAPLVCQIDSLIDTGTSYFSQICKLEDKSIEDNSGFEKIFEEKQEDNDQKSSRLLKIAISDGEFEVQAIELYKIPELSMYIKPGCKLLIFPPCEFRKGTFLLKPGNCQVLGGEVLPLLDNKRPLDRLKGLLGLKVIEKPKGPTQPMLEPEPDPEDFENLNEPCFRPSVGSLGSTRLAQEKEVFSSPVRKKLKTSIVENQIPPKPRGMLSTAKKPDPLEEMLENMIEPDEEPIQPEKTRPERPKNVRLSSYFQAKPRPSPGLKPVKKEPEDDDDIEIIEEIPGKAENLAEKAEIDPILLKFREFSWENLEKAQKKMKFSINSRRFWLILIVEDIVEPLRVVDELWTMKILLKDTTCSINCLIDNGTLELLIGFSCREAIEIRKSSDLEKRRDGKRRLEALQKLLERLDLVFEIEFFASNSSIPVIRKMKTMAELLDAY